MKNRAAETLLETVTMTGKRTTRITIERDHVWIIRQCGCPAQTWCENCAAEVEVVTEEQASVLAGITYDDIRRCVVAGQLHTFQASGKAMRICLHSLLELAHGSPTTNGRG